jgi:hypothetical protein
MMSCFLSVTRPIIPTEELLLLPWLLPNTRGPWILRATMIKPLPMAVLS